MTPAAQAFYDACCAAKEWDVVASLALDLASDDLCTFDSPALASTAKAMAAGHDFYRWTSIQPQIDREIHANREGVRDHYAWRNPWLNR